MLAKAAALMGDVARSPVVAQTPKEADRAPSAAVLGAIQGPRLCAPGACSGSVTVALPGRHTLGRSQRPQGPGLWSWRPDANAHRCSRGLSERVMVTLIFPQESVEASCEVGWAGGVAESKARATPALPGSLRTAALAPSSARVLSRPKLPRWVREPGDGRSVTQCGAVLLPRFPPKRTTLHLTGSRAPVFPFETDLRYLHPCPA